MKKGSVIGVILPDDGPFDYEWLRIQEVLADTDYRSLTVRVERSPADGIMQKDNLLAIGSDGTLAGSARRLATGGADCILWGCTSGSFAGGYNRAQAQVSALSSVSGKPATSTSMALATAALAMGAPQVDLLSAYDAAVTELFVGFLREAGVSVMKSHSLGCVLTEESFAVDLAQELSGFCARVTSKLPILVPDTAINTLDRIGELQRLAGRPVVTANQASLWHAAYLLGRAPRDVTMGFAGS
ncbi:MAG: hypothetical protein AB7F09_00035 [Parvibaculaceae bacterium]